MTIHFIIPITFKIGEVYTCTKESQCNKSMINPDCKPKKIGHRLIGEAESFYKTHIHTARKSGYINTKRFTVAEVFNIYTADKNHAKPIPW